jgi:hypothetical protein
VAYVRILETWSSIILYLGSADANASYRIASPDGPGTSRFMHDEISENEESTWTECLLIRKTRDHDVCIVACSSWTWLPGSHIQPIPNFLHPASHLPWSLHFCGRNIETSSCVERAFALGLGDASLSRLARGNRQAVSRHKPCITLN